MESAYLASLILKKSVLDALDLKLITRLSHSDMCLLKIAASTSGSLFEQTRHDGIGFGIKFFNP